MLTRATDARLQSHWPATILRYAKDRQWLYWPNTRAIAPQVGPETLYSVTSPQDVARVFKRADVLIWEGHLNQIFLNFGFNAESLRLAWLKPVDGDARYIHNNPVNPKQLSLIHLIENIYVKQFLPGVQMDIMSQAFNKSLQTTLCWPEFDVCAVKTNGGLQTVSLKALCQHVLLEAGIFSFLVQRLVRWTPTSSRIC